MVTIMTMLRKILISTLLALLVAVPAGAATVIWDDVTTDTINFGVSRNGGGPSMLTLEANSGAIATLNYYNAINKSFCFLVWCRHTPTQYRWFSVFDGTTLISRAMAYVKTTRNPQGDFFEVRVSFVASSYWWSGGDAQEVCEKCTQQAFLNGPPPNPVPIPPALALMTTALLGLFGLRRSRSRSTPKVY